MEIGKIQTTSIYRKIIIGFSILAVVILGLIAYFAFSKTVITITLNPKDVSATTTVTVKKDIPDSDKNETDVVPGYLVSTVVEGTKTFTVSQDNSAEVPAQATGYVTIHNNWTQDQPLAATTRLLTPDGILFRIKNRVDVPAGGTITQVEVYADQPGASGNIAATRFTIPGLWPGLQEKIYAESAEAMTGGLRTASAVTQTQLANAKETLISELIQKAATELSQNTDIQQNHDTVSTDAIATIIVSEQSTAHVGDEVGSFDLTVKIKAVAVIFDQAQVHALALSALRDDLNAGEQIDPDTHGTVAYDVTEYDQAKQTATVEITYTAPMVLRLSNPVFNKDKIVGKDAQNIQAYFANYDGIKSVTIRFSPFWVTKAPALRDHIEIKLQ